MWVGHFWGPMQGALSQFIDIQGFDPLTTAMSLRLRQPCLSVLWRAEKPASPPPTRLSWWANQSGCTMSHSCGHILSFFLFFSFPDFLSCCFTERATKEGFRSTDNAWCVMDIPIHIHCKVEQALQVQWLPFPTHMETDLCLLFSETESFFYMQVYIVNQVANPHWKSPSNHQLYFIPQLEWRRVALLRVSGCHVH